MKSFGKLLFSLFWAYLVLASQDSTQLLYAQSPQKTNTGFYWPTGTENLGEQAGWLSDGCSWTGNKTYFEEQYHLGKDINADLGSDVYAISDGEVVYLSPGGWGPGNVGVFVKHKLSDKSEFVAVYGHVTTSKKVGDKVEAGKPFAKIGFWEYGNHLHFGIRPNVSWADPHGLVYCPSERPKDGQLPRYDFVDPILWITTRSPQNQNTPSAAPASAPSVTNKKAWWSQSEKSTGTLAGWQTFGTCDTRRMKVYLDGNEIFHTSSEDGNNPSHSATIWMWPGDHKYQVDVFDYANAAGVEISWAFAPFGPLQPVRPACGSDIVAPSAPTPITQANPGFPTQEAAAPVPTMPIPPTIAEITPAVANLGVVINSISSPSVVLPGQKFRPQVTVQPIGVQLLESRGDMLRNTDGNLYGAWPHVAVSGSVDSGQNYTFTFYKDNPITAPNDEGTYESKWRVWANGAYVGPEITINFEVRDSGAGTSTLSGVPMLNGQVDGTLVMLTWTYDAAQPDGFKIYVDDKLFETIANPNATTYSHSFPCDKVYTFYVTAYNASGESLPSNTSRAYTGKCAEAQLANLNWSEPSSVSLFGALEFPSLLGIGVDTTGTLHAGWADDNATNYYYAEKSRHGNWSNPENVPLAGIFTSTLNEELMIGNDGRSHYIFGDSFGGSRLDEYGSFYISRLPNGEWTAPRNLLFKQTTKNTYASLAVDKHGKVFAATVGAGNLWFAEEFGNGEFKLTTIQDSRFLFSWASIVVDAFDNIHVMVGCEGESVCYLTRDSSGIWTRPVSLMLFKNPPTLLADSEGNLYAIRYARVRRQDGTFLSKGELYEKPQNGEWTGPLSIESISYIKKDIGTDEDGNLYLLGVQTTNNSESYVLILRSKSSSRWAPTAQLSVAAQRAESQGIIVSPTGEIFAWWISQSQNGWQLNSSRLE